MIGSYTRYSPTHDQKAYVQKYTVANNKNYSYVKNVHALKNTNTDISTGNPSSDFKKFNCSRQ